MHQSLQTSVIMRDMGPPCTRLSSCMVRVRGRKSSRMPMTSGFLYPPVQDRFVHPTNIRSSVFVTLIMFMWTTLIAIRIKEVTFQRMSFMTQLSVNHLSRKKKGVGYIGPISRYSLHTLLYHNFLKHTQ